MTKATAISMSQALRKARENVSGLNRFGDGWTYSVYSTKRDAWIESTPHRDYHQVALRRRASLAFEAAWLYAAARGVHGDDLIRVAEEASYNVQGYGMPLQGAAKAAVKGL